MTQKRFSGWFRLWVVVSAFWLSTIGIYSFYQYWLASTPKAAIVGADDQTSKKTRVLFSSDVSELEARTVVETKIIPDYNTQHKELPEEIRWPFEKRKAERTNELGIIFVLLGLLPPIFLFILGMAILWVRSGFKKTT